MSVQVELGFAVADTEAPLPLLCSACPGVVCFIEKTAPHALPHLAATKSPMAALGALLKSADDRAGDDLGRALLASLSKVDWQQRPRERCGLRTARALSLSTDPERERERGPLFVSRDL